MSTGARVSIASILASVLTCTFMTILDGITLGSVNWYMLILLLQVSTVAFLTIQLLKHQKFVLNTESFLVQFTTSQIVVVTLLMVYSYFFAEEVRWMSYYGILTPPLLS